MDTLGDRMRELRANGWVEEFSVDDAGVRCDACRRWAAPEDVVVDVVVLSPTAIMVCNPNQMPDEASGPARSTELSCTLEMTGGPASITATLAGNAAIAEKTAIDIEGAQVAVTPINLS